MFETDEITDEIRALQSGNSAKLSDGSVYYHLHGPEDGELVVLIHGMSMPSFVWDPNWEMLVEEGFQVLRYDLFGRGYSDRPKAQYSVDLYVRQLSELLEALALSGKKINLVGFSLGAAIGAAFAAENAASVKRICLIDPVHPADMPAAPGKIWRSLLRFKFLTVSLDQRVIDGLPNNFYRYEDFPDFEDQFCDQLQYKGFAYAITSTLIDFDYASLPEIYERVGQLGMPACLFWGKEDQLADLDTSAEIRKLIPAIQFHPIPAAGHMSHYERPDLVNPLLLDFLRS